MNFLKDLKNYIFSKLFLKTLGLIVLVYIVVVGGTILFLDSKTSHGEKIAVPNLLNKNVNSIKGLVESAGLKYEILDSIYAPEHPAGTIISQDPKPTEMTDIFVKEGRLIRIRVSKRSRYVEMPSLIDKSQRFAESVLKNRGLNYKITYETTREADGAVLNQKFNGSIIKEGTKIPIGSTIEIIVGRNLVGEPVQIPDLKCLTINEVKSRLASLSSVSLFETYVGCSNYQDSINARVTSQTPEYIEGMMSPAGTTITILLEKNAACN